MTAIASIWRRVGLLAWAACVVGLAAGPVRGGVFGKTVYWDADEIRRGMKGYGLTVFQGVKIEKFQVEVVGVLKRVRPGRDLVLCKLSGGPLAKTGVIAGMSGSPIYVDGKLLGALAYAWGFAKEPIAGITPFAQMVEFGVRRATTQPATRPTRTSRDAWRLDAPVRLGDRTYTNARTARSPSRGTGAPTGLVLTRLAVPLTVSGFTDVVFKEMCRQTEPMGIIPVQGGAAAQHLVDGADPGLEPGAALAVPFMMGDFQMAGVGTVTHREGNQVFGFGHPMLGAGPIEFPMMSGYVHTVIPSLQISSKLASPLHPAGTLNMDVDTCVAGLIGPMPDMLPITAHVARSSQVEAHTYRVRVVRFKAIQSFLIYMALSNAVGAGGDLPEELTIHLIASVTFKKHGRIAVTDMYSGPSVSGSGALYGVLGDLIGRLGYVMGNPFEKVEVASVKMHARTEPVRRWAKIESVRLDSNVVEPGQTVRARVVLLPYKGPRLVETVEMPTPKDMDPGVYKLQICDAATSEREYVRNHPHLAKPKDIAQVFELVRYRLRRNRLYGRVPYQVHGVAIDGRALPDLPDSMMHIIKTPKQTGVTPIKTALVVSKAVPMVVSGSLTVPFAVAREKRVRY